LPGFPRRVAGETVVGMLQMPTTQMTDHATIYVGKPDIPAGTTIADYRLARPRPVAWWRWRRPA
jgi:hypothetical protein